MVKAKALDFCWGSNPQILLTIAFSPFSRTQSHTLTHRMHRLGFEPSNSPLSLPCTHPGKHTPRQTHALSHKVYRLGFEPPTLSPFHALMHSLTRNILPCEKKHFLFYIFFSISFLSFLSPPRSCRHFPLCLSLSLSGCPVGPRSLVTCTSTLIMIVTTAMTTCSLRWGTGAST